MKWGKLLSSATCTPSPSHPFVQALQRERSSAQVTHIHIARRLHEKSSSWHHTRGFVYRQSWSSSVVKDAPSPSHSYLESWRRDQVQCSIAECKIGQAPRAWSFDSQMSDKVSYAARTFEARQVTLFTGIPEFEERLAFVLPPSYSKIGDSLSSWG